VGDSSNEERGTLAYASAPKARSAGDVALGLLAIVFASGFAVLATVSLASLFVRPLREKVGVGRAIFLALITGGIAAVGFSLGRGLLRRPTA